MKKILFFAIAMVLFASCDKEEEIKEKDLPSTSREFLKTHFDGVGITRIVHDKELFDRSYTVWLANGFEIDFTKSGEWDEVDGHIHPVPQSILDLLPSGITQYVTENFPKNFIVKVSKESYGFEIELNGGLEIEFNSDGSFRKFD